MAVVLVAGIGNVFLGDDGFGVEVARRVDRTVLAAEVDVVDYGVRGIHLAYDLLDGAVRTLIMVDALPSDDPPGTVSLLEVGDDGGTAGPAPVDPQPVDSHAMHPEAVLAALRNLGGHVERVLVVGCRPQLLAPVMGLSAPVAAAVAPAARLAAATAARAAAGYRQTSEVSIP